MKKILKEPLLHFLVLGILLYITTAFIQHRKDPNRQIVVDNATIGRLVSQYIIQNGTPPDKNQLDGLINSDIKEEIEYREAMRLGLDKDDEIIRRRLSQKIEFLKTDLAVVNEPSIQDMREYYAAHPELYKDSATVTFTHIYLKSDNLTSDQIDQKAKIILAELKKKDLTRAPDLGDRFSLQYDYNGIDKLEAVQLFGDSPLSTKLFNMPLHQWTGPVRSGYGWHLVYLEQRKDGRIAPFDEVKDAVRDSYITSIKQQQNNEQWDDMKNKYTINRKYLQATDK